MSEFEVDQVRAMFPALVSTDEKQSPIFLDNPAGTQVPGTVIEAVGQAITGDRAILPREDRSDDSLTAVVEGRRQSRRAPCSYT